MNSSRAGGESTSSPSERGSVVLRPASADDEVTIKSMVKEARVSPAGLDWRHFIVAAVGDEEVVGCGQLRPHRDGSLELASIVVVRAWRRMGVGQAIIRHLMALADQPLWLTCRSGLVPYYEKFGFNEVGAKEQQPPHFQRILHLAGLFQMLSAENEYLAVMVCRNPGSGPMQNT